MIARWRRRVSDELSQRVYDMLIWPDHFLRQVDREVDFTFVNDLCASAYKNGSAKGGRPAEEPERVFRALLVMALYGLPSETCLMRELDVNLAFRWFCGFSLRERAFDHSLFYVVRDRLGVTCFESILARIFQQCMEKGLVSHEWAFYDMTTVEASATPYTLYERAVIVARAVWRLWEESPQVRERKDPSQPLMQADVALKQLVAEVAKDVAQAKQSKVKNIVKGVERLAKAAATEAKALPKRERAARQLADVRDEVPAIERGALKKAMQKMLADLAHAKGDSDACIGSVKRGVTFCGYLSGIMIDGKYKIIGATHLEPGNASQAKALIESDVTKQYTTNAGQAPEKAAFDAAFGYPHVVLHLQKDWPETDIFVDPHAPPPLQPKQLEVFHSDEFTLLEDDSLLCPNTDLPNQWRQMQVQSRRKDGTLEYAGRACADCTLRSQCTTKAQGPRVVKCHPEKRRLRQAMEIKAETPEHKAAMRKRMAYIEPVFGHGKQYHGWRKAPYRDLRMNRIFNCLVAIALDVEKLVRYAPLERQMA